MKLKRLDIHGFKSFYHRTTLAFDEGITAVVGPNGCGKSNIVDSIKWVMGEQGAKSLRGESMEDVIFAGSDRKGPLGLCEVRLTFHNDGSAEVPARWREVSEIAIERRMERGGGSDYLVNKTRCRLADVQELIAGTGVASGGQRAYAIIEQGRISGIIGARPEERRVLIEEAAGITRYRVRKRVAEKKMEETRLNLERVADVVGEVETRLKSLQRQAKKAERYKEYRDELRAGRLRAAAFEYLSLAAELERLEVKRRDAEAAEADAIRQLDATEAKRAAARLREKEVDEHARRLTERLRAAEEVAQKLASRLEVHDSEVRGLYERLEAARAEVEETASRRGRLEAERTTARERLATLEVAADEGGPSVDALEQASARAQEALRTARAAAEELRRRAADEGRALERARAQREAAARRASDLLRRLEGLAGERESLSGQRLAVDQRRDDSQARLEAAETEVGAARAAGVAADEARRRAQEALRVAEADERAAREQLAGARSRLQSLEELEARREGLGEGSKLVLARGAAAGVVGPVAEQLAVPAELEKAVAAALGARLGGVVVRDLDAARGAVEHLRAINRGRAVLVPDGLRAVAADGGRRRLADLLGLSGLAAALVGDAVLADDLAGACAIVADGFDGVVVTLDGDRIEGGGVVTGGAGGADAAPLSRRREIRELKARVAALDGASREAAERAADARAQAGEARAALDESARRLHRGELARAEARKDLDRAEADRRQVAERSSRLDQSAGSLRDELEEAQETEGTAAHAVAAGEKARAERERAVAAAEDQVGLAEAEREHALALLHEARTREATRRERVTAARDALTRVAAQLDEVERRAARLEGEVEAGEGRLRSLAGARSHLEAELAAARAEAGERASAVADARAAHGEMARLAETVEGEVTKARDARERARDTLADSRLTLQERRLRLEHLERTIESTYACRLVDLLPEYQQQSPPDVAERARLDELETLIQRMGDINLTAIEEHAEVAERYEFLERQRADLQAALDDLDRAIEQINKTCRQLFRETFDAVNERFKAIFPRLFRGGEAELLLTNPDDLLETGLEVNVQPPGKKVQSVGLLSGGEKAMCAIALVFAVFQVKPSPFCLLDEVDAPLDDANIGRFNEIVREMAQTSQIVLITHNKRTMEIADVLYGVTMEEPGISKLVSVRMT